MKAIDDGIIDANDLQNQIDMARRDDILRRHPYRIFYNKDGRWGTYLPDPVKGRKLIKKKSKEALEDAIVEFYKEDGSKMTFIEAFHEWRYYHDQMIGSNSAHKYESDEKRFFTDTDLARMKIVEITQDDIEVFIKTRTEDLKLCQSACKTLYHYIDNTFRFSIRHGYIKLCPTEYIKAKDFYKYCAESSRSNRTKTINDDTLMRLNELILKDHANKPEYIAPYALEFASLTGMRVGEIAALTWDCVFNDYILVNKSQKYNTQTREYYIDYTKNRKDRKFPLTPDIRALLDEIKDVETRYGYLSDFIFSDANGGLTFRVISSCIKNKCRQLGIQTFGIHAYRRTVNSKMSCAGVPTAVRASLLGHSTAVNEKYYTYDVSSMEDKIGIISDINRQMRQV